MTPSIKHIYPRCEHCGIRAVANHGHTETHCAACGKPAEGLPEKPLKLAVVGTRTFDGRDFMDFILNRIHANHPLLTIISGDGGKADKAAAAYAKTHGIPLVEFPADWSQYGLSAGPRRNQQIVDEADAVLAFWDGVSRGTRITMDMGVKKGIVVRVEWPFREGYDYKGETE